MRNDFVVALEETEPQSTTRGQAAIPARVHRRIRGAWPVAGAAARGSLRLPASPWRRPAFAAAGWYFSRPAPPGPGVRRPRRPWPSCCPPCPPVSARQDLARREERRLRAVQQRPAHRHHVRVTGEPRYFRVFEAGAGMREEVHDKPVGHPLPHLRKRHLAARRKLQREPAHQQPEPAALPEAEPRLQLPDRPLRARLPRGDGRDKANHAGHSVGRRTKQIYLSLNNAFLGRVLRDALGGRAGAAHHGGAARGRPQPDRLAAPALGDRRRHVRGPRPREREREEAPHRPPRGLGARLPLRGLRPARPVRATGPPRGAFRLRLRRRLPEGGGRALAGGAGGGAGSRSRGRATQGKTVEDVRRERQALFDRWQAEQAKDEQLAPERAAERRPHRRRATPRDAGARPDAPYRANWGRNHFEAEDSDMPEHKDHLWKVAEEAQEKIESLVSGAPRGARRGHEQDGGGAQERQPDPDRGPAQRVHPRALLALHREDHPGPERHHVLPGRRRARHLRLRHRGASRTCSTSMCDGPWRTA